MLDLAVPRDIEAEVAQLPHIALFTVDDMAERVAHGKEARAPPPPKQKRWCKPK